MTNLQLNIISFLFLIFGISIRIYKLDSQSFWMDELFSIVLASKSTLSDLIAAHQIETNPPFHTIFLFYWIKIFGDSVFSLRFTSALFGTFTLFLLFYLIIKPIVFPKRIYVYSLAIFSTCLGGLYFSQEVRSYSLMILLSLIYLLFFNKILIQLYDEEYIEYKKYLGLYLSSIMLSFTHYFGLIFAGIGLLILCFHTLLQSKFRILFKIFSIGLLVLVSYSLEFVKLSSIDTGRVNWIPSPNLFIYLEFLNYIFYFLKGKYFLYFIFMFIIMLITSIVRKKIKNISRSESTILYSYSFLIVLVIVTTYLVSQFKPIVTARNLLVLVFPLLFIFSYLVNLISFKRKYILDLLVIVFSLYLFFQFYRDYLKPHKTDFRSLAEFCMNPDFKDIKLYSKDSQEFYNYYLIQNNSFKRVESLPEISTRSVPELPKKFILVEADLLSKLNKLDLNLLKKSYNVKNYEFLGSNVRIFEQK